MEESGIGGVIDWMTRVFGAATRAPSVFDPQTFAALSEAIAERIPHDRLSILMQESASRVRLVAAARRRACAGDAAFPAASNVDLGTEFIAAMPAGVAPVVCDDTRDESLPWNSACRSYGLGSYVLAAFERPDNGPRACLLFSWIEPGNAGKVNLDDLDRLRRLLSAFVPSALQNIRASRLAQMIDDLPHGVVAIDRAGCVVESNRAALMLTGQPDGLVVGMPFENVLDPLSRPAFREAVSRPNGAGPLTLEVRTGSDLHPIDVTATPVSAIGPIARQLHIQDARPRIASEAELERRAEALALLHAVAETVAGELNAGTALDEALALLMARLPVRGAVIARAMWEEGRLLPVASRGLSAELQSAFLAQSPERFARRGTSSASTPPPPDLERLSGPDEVLMVVPLRHAEQMVGVALFAAHRDVAQAARELLLAGARTIAIALHASVEYAEAVRLAAERRQLLDSIPSIVFRADPRTGATLYANGAVERVLGSPVARALGLPGLEGLLADAAEQESMAAMRRAVADGQDSGWIDRRFRHRDGRTLVLRTRLYPVVDANVGAGDATVIEGIAQDVTDEIEARKQLVQADRLASLGMLAAGVAHEINNPTAFISLGVQQLGRMLSQMPEEPDAIGSLRRRMSEVLTELSDGVQRIVQIVGELKLFARIPESAFSTPVDVNRLITSAVTLARSELRRRARVEVELGDLPPLPGDHARLGQVFVNLLINAAQAIPPGAEEINVIRVSTHAHDGYVQVDVSDTGVGIPAENLQRIFDPFFTTKPPGEGTGLGLAISFDLVRRAGGTIDVVSTVGKGTSFSVKLPVRDFVPQRGSKPMIPIASPGTRVLVVEDEHHLGVAIARALASTYMVELAPDAETALERIERGGGREYDAVLCDLRMPGMDGKSFYDAVLARWPAQAERFVFLTGAGFGGEFEPFVRSTDRPVLEKPFEMSELEQIVADMVRQSANRPTDERDVATSSSGK